ncbi:7TM diverse intracellular signaling domain-containing protein [Sulfurimonas sp.]|uniref:7TM diverse intracellular signaling domain-containing protein n=1 Tax=Sulfurimonas sp. TaxID=2022749 RepID=UPI003D0B1456
MIFSRFLYLLIFLFSFELFGSSDISLLETSEIFIDKGAKLGYVQVVEFPELFSKSQTDFISRGYTTDEAIWIKFTLHNDSNETLKRVLHIDNSMLDTITLYQDENSSETKGALHRDEIEGILDFYFYIELQQKEHHTYYLRVLSNSCATYFHLYLETKDELWRKTLNRELILGAFFSLLFTLLIYNFFIFLFTREKLYLFYTLFVLALANNHLSYTAMTMPVLTNLLTFEEIKTYTAIDAYLGIYYFAVLVIFLLLFSRELMQLKKYKFFDTFVKLQLISYVLLALFSQHYFYLLDIMTYLSVLTIFFLLLCASYLLHKREENSIYLVLGFGLNLVGTLSWLFFNTGTYIPKGGYWYFYEISISIEALLFAIILSKRLNHTKALADSLSTQKTLIRELHHRVKNNLQFIVSFYRLKLRRHLSNDAQLMLQEAEQSVRSIGKIHEILYAQKNLTHVDMQTYFEQLADEIKRGYTTKIINTTIKTDITLGVDEAIYCGIIINELITNSIKYAFTDDMGEIVVSFDQNDSQNTLCVQDDGVGFDYDSKKDSFGLSFIENLVSNELKGKLLFDKQNGAKFTITWGGEVNF